MTDKPNISPADLDKEAKDLYQAGKYQKAAEIFSRAAALYEQGGEPCLTAEMRNNQGVSLLQANQPGPALEAIKGTREIFGQAGDRLKMGMALANEATALKELGRLDPATAKFTEAAAVFRELGEEELLVQTSQSLSSLKLKSRNIPGALFSLQEALESVQKPNLRQKLLLNLLKLPNKLLDR
jgi:tetratricopeptide (TPR) repeat protein